MRNAIVRRHVRKILRRDVRKRAAGEKRDAGHRRRPRGGNLECDGRPAHRGQSLGLIELHRVAISAQGGRNRSRTIPFLRQAPPRTQVAGSWKPPRFGFVRLRRVVALYGRIVKSTPAQTTWQDWNDRRGAERLHGAYGRSRHQVRQRQIGYEVSHASFPDFTRDNALSSCVKLTTQNGNNLPCLSPATIPPDVFPASNIVRRGPPSPGTHRLPHARGCALRQTSISRVVSTLV
jgi:hypothetical protein